MLTREQRNWILDNVGSPAAPLLWFAYLKPATGPLRWLLELAKWLVLIVWAVGFLWIWFPVFAILFLWEGFSRHLPVQQAGGAPKSSEPAEPSGH